MPDQRPRLGADLQRFAQLLVSITVELGEPGTTPFDDLPRLVREQHARIAELEKEAQLRAVYDAWLQGQHGIDETYWTDFLEWREADRA